MDLPKSDKAIVDQRKVRDYLLSHEHPLGRSKAHFFSRVGFPPSEWRRFISELERLAREGEVQSIKEFRFGRKYVVRGKITGLGAQPVEVESVWFVAVDGDAPRLVTVYPR